MFSPNTSNRYKMTTKLEQQVKDWEIIHKHIQDARKLKEELRQTFLRNEVYPRVKEYAEKYNTKYDFLNKPR